VEKIGEHDTSINSRIEPKIKQRMQISCGTIIGQNAIIAARISLRKLIDIGSRQITQTLLMALIQLRSLCRKDDHIGLVKSAV
jgi:hypothetical protein